MSPLFARLRTIAALDWLMLLLALISIGLLSYENWGPVTAEQRRLILSMDVLICAIFALEFSTRLYREPRRLRFIMRNWYEILGMIPAAHPVIRGFRLFRVIRIFILLSRFGAAADRAFGEEFTYRLLSNVKQGVADAIGGVVTVAVLDEVAEVLKKGRFAGNIANALAENRSDLEMMLREKLREDPQLGRFRRLPFYDDLVHAVIVAMLRVTEETLRDARTDELISDALRENLQQIRGAVWEREEARHTPANPR